MWSLDRRVAAAALGGAILALAVPIAATHAPPPPGASRDPLVLARELTALANRGARTSWIVTYDFTRTTATGDKLQDVLAIAHRPSIEVDSGLGSEVVTVAGRTYTCTVVQDAPQCLSRRSALGTARPGDTYGGAVVDGRYAISAAPAESIAGFDAACFDLRLRTGNPVPGIGFASEQCYSSDGIPLRSSVTTAGGTDERVARGVGRKVGRDELLPLLSQYGLSRLAPAA